MVKLYRWKHSGLGIRGTRFCHSGATYWPKPGGGLKLPFIPSVVTKCKRSLLSVGSLSLISSLLELYLDDYISLLTSLLSSSQLSSNLATVSSPNCKWSHVISFSVTGCLWRCRDVKLCKPSIQHSKPFSYCYALGYFLVCSQSLSPVFFLSLYCREPQFPGSCDKWLLARSASWGVLVENARVFLSLFRLLKEPFQQLLGAAPPARWHSVWHK